MQNTLQLYTTGTVVKIFVICCLLIYIPNVSAQKNNSIAISAGFLQLKEGFNYGLVFRGEQIQVQYQHIWHLNNFKISYSPKLAVGTPFSKGIFSINLYYAPIDVSFLQSVYKQNSHILKIGGNLATHYNYQVYPDLHGGRLFWFGEIGLSLVVEYAYSWKNKKIGVALQNSVVGFVSHTGKNEPYFYSFKFSDFFTRPNSHLKFGSFDKYDHTRLTFEFTPNVEKRHSFAVGMEYMGTWQNIHFQSLNYYLQWKKLF